MILKEEKKTSKGVEIELVGSKYDGTTMLDEGFDDLLFYVGCYFVRSKENPNQFLHCFSIDGKYVVDENGFYYSNLGKT